MQSEPTTVVIPKCNVSEEVQLAMDTGDLTEFKVSSDLSSIFSPEFGCNADMVDSFAGKGDDGASLSRSTLQSANMEANKTPTEKDGFTQDTLTRHMRPGAPCNGLDA
eukprot:1911006-Pleurochrysis_carterae.AAC.3